MGRVAQMRLRRINEVIFTDAEIQAILENIKPVEVRSKVLAKRVFREADAKRNYQRSKYAK